MFKTLNQKMFKVALAAAFASIAVGLTSASAVLVRPPGNGIPVPTTGSSVGITAAQLAALPPSQFQNPTFSSANFSGFLNQYVFQETAVANPLMGLTFAYQIDSDIKPGITPLDSAIDTLGISSFSLATVQDANQGIPPGPLFGGDPSDTVSSDGNLVVFTFPGGSFPGGDVSSWLFVRTNAHTFGFGTATISGTGTATATAFVPVPEPTTVLFGLALFGVVGLGRRRS